MGYNYNSLNTQDIQVGHALPELCMPITRTSVVMAASASRDWQPHHHDHAYSQKQAGKKDIFMGIWWYMGIVTRLITDWAGPDAFVRSLSIKLRESLYPGDDMRVTGNVTAIHVEGAEVTLELDVEVSNQNGLVAPGTAKVSLPIHPRPITRTRSNVTT